MANSAEHFQLVPQFYRQRMIRHSGCGLRSGQHSQWSGRVSLQVDYTIDEVLLYYRTVSSVREAQRSRTESLRTSLKITKSA